MILDRVSRKNRWGIIADDLTGATDSAAAFARAGFPALVLFEKTRVHELPGQVVVLSSDSRQSSPAVARRKVQSACRWLHQQGIPLLYKKLDSTLHGNIATEIATIRDTARFDTALFCPANPAQGRVVRRGCLLVHGEERGRLHERLGFPYPAGDSRVASPRGAPSSPGQLEDVASVFAPSNTRACARALNESRLVLADAVSFADLGRLTTAALQSKRRVLLAGSAGMAWSLARHLGRVLGISALPSRALRPSRQGAARPFLVFSGSANPVTRRQIRLLQKRRKAQVMSLNARSAVQARRALAAGRPVVIRMPVHAQSERKILAHLKTFTPLVREKAASGFVVVGGDTTLLLCRWLRPRALAIEGEILPGLAWGRWIGGVAAGLRVCTKPGGFGTEDALERITQK